jgi:hypothetical protein
MARPNEEMDLLGSDDDEAPVEAPAAGGEEEEESAEGQAPQMSVKPGADGGFEVTLKIGGSAAAPPAPLPGAPGAPSTPPVGEP